MIIVRYGEIGLKSPQTRRVMENQLIENIKAATGLKRVKREHGRIFAESDAVEDARKISRVFGVVSTSVAVKTSSELEEIIKAGVGFAKERVRGDLSFAVRARRKGSHEYSSGELAASLGAAIQRETRASVDLSNPDVTIHVEVRDRDAYLFDRIIEGVGGMPLGTQGKALALLSGGIDSPVAAWLMMKRGVRVVALFMDCRPLVDDRTIDRALKTIELLSNWSNAPIKTYVVPYGEALIKFLKYDNLKLGCVLCKRMMYHVAGNLAGKEKAFGIITGESLGQVASQTIENLSIIEKDIDIPIYRPLIAMDKTEIVDRAKEIGTYEASIAPANCCLGPPIHPEIRAEWGRIKKAEEELNMEALVREALGKVKVHEVGADEKG